MQIGTREKMFLNVSVAVLILSLLCLALYRPKNRQLTNSHKSISIVHNEIKKAGDAAQLIASSQKQLSIIQKELSSLEERVLGGKSTPQMMQLLAKKTEELGIDILSINPLPTVDIPESGGLQVKKLPVQINVRCSYRMLGKHVEVLRDSPILIRVENLEILSDEEILPHIEARLLVSSYMSDQKP